MFMHVKKKKKSMKYFRLSSTDTHLQQLAALLQTTLFRWGTGSDVAHKDPSEVSSDYGDVISQTGFPRLG